MSNVSFYLLLVIASVIVGVACYIGLYNLRIMSCIINQIQRSSRKGSKYARTRHIEEKYFGNEYNTESINIYLPICMIELYAIQFVMSVYVPTTRVGYWIMYAQMSRHPPQFLNIAYTTKQKVKCIGNRISFCEVSYSSEYFRLLKPRITWQ